MPPFDDMMLGILSWRAPRTIAATLANHAARGLPGHFARALVLFQEGGEEDRALAARHGYEALCLPDNLGIHGGVRRLAEELDARFLLMLENDHVVVEPAEAVGDVLARARAELIDGAHVVRMRSRRQPGDNVMIAKYLRTYGVVQPLAGSAERLEPGSRIERLLRRSLRARRESVRIGTAIHVEEDPVARHPRAIRRSPHGNFLVSSAHAQWTNQCYLVSRRFLLDTLLARARADAERQPVSGRTIETNLPRGWWLRAGFTVAFSDPGLFTHRRLDR